MKCVNVYIARRGRREHLENCLYYLNQANSKVRYDVVVFICSDDPIDVVGDFPNLRMVWTYAPSKVAEFNKARLLNDCVSLGNQSARKYDWVSIVDLDMIYPENWFTMVEQQMLMGVDYLVCHGWKLGDGTQNDVNKHPSFEALLQLPKEEFSVGPSQVSISQKGYQIIQQYFPGNLYREEFLGWGGEDSVLSSISRKLSIEKRLQKAELNGIWLHQYHEFKGNHPTYPANYTLYKKINSEIMSKTLS